MRKLMQAATVAIMLMPVACVAQENVSGEMRCNVKSNSVTEIEDGITKTYSGIENQFEVNDALEFTYALHSSSKILEVWLRDAARDRSILRVRSELDSWESSETQFYAPIQDMMGFVSFGANSIWLSSPFGQLLLQRYFKNDWQGMGAVLNTFGSTTSITHQVYALDCRTITDKIDEVRSALTAGKG